MTEDMIKKVIEIDENSKKVIKESEDKKINIQKYINQELAIKESVIEANNKTNIEKVQKEYDDKYSKIREEIEEETNYKIQKMRDKFEENKETMVNELFSDIIKKVEGQC